MELDMQEYICVNEREREREVQFKCDSSTSTFSEVYGNGDCDHKEENTRGNWTIKQSEEDINEERIESQHGTWGGYNDAAQTRVVSHRLV